MNFKLLGAGAAVVVAFWAGLKWSDRAWEARFAAFRMELAEQSAQSLREAQAQSAKWQADLTQAQKNYAAEKTELNARYDRMRAQLDRVRAERAGSADRMPAASQSAAGACSPCRCEPSAKDGSGIAEALAIARDCDLLALRYNALLDFFSTVKKDNQNGQN